MIFFGGTPASIEARRADRAERNARSMNVDHLQDSLGKRTIQGGGIFIASHVAKLIIQFGTLAVLGRLLLPDDFGLMAMSWAVLAFVSMFADLGLGTATIQRKEIDQNTTSVLFFTGIGVGFIVAAVVSIMAPVAAALFRDDRLMMVVPAMALTIPINMLSIQHYALLNRTMRWIDLQIAALLSQSIGAIVAICVALFTPLGYWALVAQAWVGAIAYSTYLIVRCDWWPSRPHDWRAAWSSIKMGLNLTGFTFLNYFHRQLDNILIGWRWGTTELGHYARAYALLLAPINFVNGPIGNALEPALSRLQDKPEQWRRAYLDGLGVVVLIGGAITAVLFGGAKPVIETVYGPGWDATVSIFGVLALSMLFGTPMSSVGWIYISLGRTSRMFRWAMIATPVYVASFLIGLPFGPVGVATAYSIAVGLLFLPCFLMAVRNTPVSIGDALNTIWPLSVCCAAIGVGLHFITPNVSILMGLFLTGLGLSIYMILAAILVWVWPPYASIKGHAIKGIDSLKRRFLRGA